jgi:hypothetical protein
MPEQLGTVRDPHIPATPVQSEMSEIPGGEILSQDGIEETLITPMAGWPSLELRDLWNYRFLIYQLTLRNIKVRYKQTLLGVLWAVLQPVLMTVVFAFTLGRLIGNAQAIVPYPIFVLSGLLPWVFFQRPTALSAPRD